MSVDGVISAALIVIAALVALYLFVALVDPDRF